MAPSTSASNGSVSQNNQHFKPPAPANDGEDAPLLVNDDSAGDVEAQEDDYVEGKSKKDKLRIFFRRCYQWVLANIMFVVVACLLAAGTIALGVYFGSIIYPSLRSGSRG